MNIQRSGANGLALRHAIVVVAMAVMLVLSAGVSLANNDFPLYTSDQISGMKHGERVLLRGYITPLTENRYTFRDDAGTITVLMTEAQWNAAKATSEDLVDLYGKTTKESDGMMFRVRRANKAE